MAKHDIALNLPSLELGKSEASFSISRNGETFGTITISKGNLEWYPAKAKHSHKMSWGQFDKIITARV